MFWRLAFFKFSPVSVDVGGFVGFARQRTRRQAFVVDKPRAHHHLDLGTHGPAGSGGLRSSTDGWSLSDNSGHCWILARVDTVANGRVEMWRGGFRQSISVAASFV